MCFYVSVYVYISVYAYRCVFIGLICLKVQQWSCGEALFSRCTRTRSMHSMRRRRTLQNNLIRSSMSVFSFRPYFVSSRGSGAVEVFNRDVFSDFCLPCQQLFCCCFTCIILWFYFVCFNILFSVICRTVFCFPPVLWHCWYLFLSLLHCTVHSNGWYAIRTYCELSYS